MIRIIKRIDYSRKFDKQLRKSSTVIKISFKEKLTLFSTDPFHPQLNNHALIGKYVNYRSINITGDWRAIFQEGYDEDGNIIIVFLLIVTHSQLYK